MVSQQPESTGRPDGFDRSVSRHFEASRGSVRLVRRMVAEHLAATPPPRLDAALLVASELANTACMHGSDEPARETAVMITYRPVGYAPVELAPDVHLIRQACAAAGDVQTVYMSSLLIRGRQPLLVDTGPPVARDLWFDSVWSLVDPADVRWVFISHDDVDHIGNVMQVLAMCPNATLLTTAFAVSRSTAAFDMPYERMRWLQHRRVARHRRSDHRHRHRPGLRQSHDQCPPRSQERRHVGRRHLRLPRARARSARMGRGPRPWRVGGGAPRSRPQRRPMAERHRPRLVPPAAGRPPGAEPLGRGVLPWRGPAGRHAQTSRRAVPATSRPPAGPTRRADAAGGAPPYPPSLSGGSQRPGRWLGPSFLSERGPLGSPRRGRGFRPVGDGSQDLATNRATARTDEVPIPGKRPLCRRVRRQHPGLGR